MSRFDDELTKTADNAWQTMVGQPPRQPGGYEQGQFRDPFAESFPTMAPPVDDVAAWTSNQPARRMLQVTDLDAADPLNGRPGEITGSPETTGGAVLASTDDSLYEIYKSSRQIREAIEAGTDFDFRNLYTASINSVQSIKSASDDRWLVQTVGTIASLVDDIENELLNTGNYHQAHTNLNEFESYLEEISKYASGDEVMATPTEDETGSEPQMVGTGASKFNSYAQRQASTEPCIGHGCTTKACKGVKADGTIHEGSVHEATNGNQETLQHDDVRALDNVGPYMQNLQADAVVDVTAPQVVNGEDAGYVDYYNDGAETGIVPGQEPHKQEVFPNDATNPAMVPYQGLVASRERIFEALQVVERLEKMGMVDSDHRAKHIAKFEQMSDAKLAGFKASLDMLEESGARQPRSQKVASGNNRMPEMGRLTTASTSSRQSILTDDWLMTL